MKVRSEFDLSRGEGWYDQGTVATVLVDEVSGVVIVHMFQERIGDVGTTIPKAYVPMNSPKEAVALWKTDSGRFYITLTFVLAMIGCAGLSCVGYRKSEAQGCLCVGVARCLPHWLRTGRSRGRWEEDHGHSNNSIVGEFAAPEAQSPASQADR